MTQSKWTERDENGEYIHFLMRHEVYDHGRSESEAVAILTKYFGSDPDLHPFKKVTNQN